MTTAAAPARAEETVTTRSPATPVVAILLAACAGAVDLWAITSLGGAYAGVATGNLISIGRAAGEGRFAALAPPGIAITGFALGVGCWPLLWRHQPQAVTGPLAAELALLTVVAGGWVATASHPGQAPTLALLAVAAMAMGAQSATALRLGEPTTYLTGALTGIVVALVSGKGLLRLTAARQLIALTAGASIAALLLVHLRWAVPVAAVAPLSAAMVVRGIPAMRARRHSPQEGTS